MRAAFTPKSLTAPSRRMWRSLIPVRDVIHSSEVSRYDSKNLLSRISSGTQCPTAVMPARRLLFCLLSATILFQAESHEMSLRGRFFDRREKNLTKQSVVQRQRIASSNESPFGRSILLAMTLTIAFI